MSVGTLEITSLLVRGLISDQFPQFSHLPVTPVIKGGCDNRTFRLGDKLLIRLPSAERYASQVTKEQKWLAFFAQHLSVPIPEPVALGRPTNEYPWNWSIYRWIPGESADQQPESSLPEIAVSLAGFLLELQRLEYSDGPEPGAHNFYRGASPSVYNGETRDAIAKLREFIDVSAATQVWEKALSSSWSKNPVWIHGDFSAGNILFNKGRLAAVIDFGSTGIGDPACDLVIAWTFLKSESRHIFRTQLGLDSDTWSRARGWALWKALITLVACPDKTGPEALMTRRLISSLLDEQS